MARKLALTVTGSPIRTAQPGEGFMQLCTTDIHVWLIDLDADCPDANQVEKWLHQVERERATRIRDPQQARRWRFCRAAMREILAAYCGQSPHLLKFRQGHNDKPELGGLTASAPLHFNLSHSARFALLGVTRNNAIGIDIEVIRPIADAETVARRFFTLREQAHLNALEGSLQTAAFFECWTRKEAVLKATGEGIGASLEKLCVTFGDGGRPRVLEYHGSSSVARNWSLLDLDLVAGYKGALAMFSPALGTVSTFRFP